MVSHCACHPNPLRHFKGSLVDPQLRASNEHIPIVRVPRAGGRPGYPSHPSQAARCASKGSNQAAPSASSPSSSLGELTPSAERRSLSVAFEPQEEESPWDFNRYRIGH
jgi:hypothetical protein